MEVLVSEWQPIETAKGREVLVFDPRWGVAEGLRNDSGRWSIASFNGTVLYGEPTHWMPKPPEPDEGREHQSSPTLTLADGE
jgi:hypothetical protein